MPDGSATAGCYEYADPVGQWRSLPPTMSPEVTKQTAMRIGEHASAHELLTVKIIRHGGEPLATTAENLDDFSSTMVDTIGDMSPRTQVFFSVQTNGLPLAGDNGRAKELLNVLWKYEYNVGVSLDGDRVANDRHRLLANGRSSYDLVSKALQRVRDSIAYMGILAVVDIDNNPIATLDSLASYRPNILGMLLPHANHEVPVQAGATTHGEWLRQAFDWYLDRPQVGADGLRNLTQMPIFDSIMTVLLGGKSRHESVAGGSVREINVLSDGSYQRLDTLKITEPGAVATAMDVWEHSLDEVTVQDPGIIARRLGRAGLAQECQVCPLVEACGGGYYPHRFKSGEQPLQPTDPPEVFADAFRHPTVYCPDQKTLLPHIARRLEGVLLLAGHDTTQYPLLASYGKL
jgi:uncharacterized protein